MCALYFVLQDWTTTMQELKFDPETGLHVLETLPKNVDVGPYTFSFEVFLSLQVYCYSLSFFMLSVEFMPHSDSLPHLKYRFCFTILKIRTCMLLEGGQKYLCM